MDLTNDALQALPPSIRARYEIREVRNAAAVIRATNPTEFSEIVAVLEGFTLLDSDIVDPGKNKSEVAKRLDEAFRKLGWREGRHDIEVRGILTLTPYKAEGETVGETVEPQVVLSEGYKVDNVKGRIAVDVEWNAKDGNLDRDLGAYRALYDAGIIDAAVVITRTQDDLRARALALGVGKRFGTTTTTNLAKLEPRMTRGACGGCPLLAIAITVKCQ